MCQQSVTATNAFELSQDDESDFKLDMISKPETKVFDKDVVKDHKRLNSFQEKSKFTAKGMFGCRFWK